MPEYFDACFDAAPSIISFSTVSEGKKPENALFMRLLVFLMKSKMLYGDFALNFCDVFYSISNCRKSETALKTDNKKYIF